MNGVENKDLKDVLYEGKLSTGFGKMYQFGIDRQMGLVVTASGFSRALSIEEIDELVLTLVEGKNALCKKHMDAINANRSGEAQEAKSKLLVRPSQPIKSKGRKVRYVYLMLDTNTNCTKIGISKNPKYRESTLQSEKPTIKMIGFKQGTYKDEKRLHDMFSGKRVRGEWFRLDKADVKNAIDYLNNK